jgi:hypothetical protein
MRTIVAGRCGERRINGFACCFVWAWDRDRACAGDDGVPVADRWGTSRLTGPPPEFLLWFGLGRLGRGQP